MSGTRPISETRVQANGLTFAVTDWPGAEPAVFLAHATSFHARCWDQVVERLPGIHCIAIDMRGHGRSDRPPPPYPWLAFGEDVAAVAEDGLRVVDVWESAAAFQAFVDTRLMPVVKQVGITAEPKVTVLPVRFAFAPALMVRPG
jgi:alpha-beta hydrolase superfamily lysophospholipase